MDQELTRIMQALTPGTPQPELTAAIAQSAAPGELRAGLAFLNGAWDLAHRIAQSTDSAVGAHWHAIIHRHEPDFPNSKYWLRRAGDSPIYPALAQAAAQAGHGADVAPGGGWEPYLFTDCFAKPALADWTHPLDALECRLLLDGVCAKLGVNPLQWR